MQILHSTGTCTFYGTANSNQLIAELLGLHLPGHPLSIPMTLAGGFHNCRATRVTGMTHLGGAYNPIGRIVDEKAVVNAIVGVLATGGSTNQTMHLVAMARAAGIRINWDDFSNSPCRALAGPDLSQRARGHQYLSESGRHGGPHRGTPGWRFSAQRRADRGGTGHGGLCLQTFIGRECSGVEV